MAANPFDDEDGVFFALTNDEGQHSLWPAGQPVPAGWQVAFGRDSRQNCLRYVEEHWTDLRPASLAARTPAGGAA
ncbi:MbtH family protein [Streptomyces sp. NPDC035033]|uniref:MbtH family protein n=1 Tax=Streptomyces sp. NPDC035033 TaxID=3155368 RepID=UPI0033DF074B